MPLLPGLAPKAEATAAGKLQAEKMGTALIKHLFGDRYGENPKFDGIADGIQNFNGFVVGDDGERKLFLSFLRFGQGEIQDEGHVRKNLECVNKLVEGGFSTPRYITGSDNDPILKVPNTVIIDGQEMPVPNAIKGGWATAQEYFRGTTMPNPLQKVEQAMAMGQLMGRFYTIGGMVFDDIGTMPSAVSPRALEQMLQSGLGLNTKKSVAETIADLGPRGSDARKAVHKTIAVLQSKIDEEKEILAHHPENDDIIRRQKSLNIAIEFNDALKNDWGLKLFRDYDTAGKLWQEQGFDNLPDARIHGDFHSGNFFEEGVMYDMGYLGDGKRLFDMCQALAISCHKDGKFWPEAAHAFVQGVQQECPLTKQELDAFPEMLHFTYLRSTTTRFTSLITSTETQFVTKSPLELQARRRAYEQDVLSTGKNWARGEFVSKGMESESKEERRSISPNMISKNTATEYVTTI